MTYFYLTKILGQIVCCVGTAGGNFASFTKGINGEIHILYHIIFHNYHHHYDNIYLQQSPHHHHGETCVETAGGASASFTMGATATWNMLLVCSPSQYHHHQQYQHLHHHHHHHHHHHRHLHQHQHQQYVHVSMVFFQLHSQSRWVSRQKASSELYSSFVPPFILPLAPQLLHCIHFCIHFHTFCTLGPSIKCSWICTLFDSDTHIQASISCKLFANTLLLALCNLQAVHSWWYSLVVYFAHARPPVLHIFAQNPLLNRFHLSSLQ